MVKRKHNEPDFEKDTGYKRVRTHKREDNGDNILNGDTKRSQSLVLDANEKVTILSGDETAVKIKRRAAKIERRKLKRQKQNSITAIRSASGDDQKGPQIKQHRSRKKVPKDHPTGDASGWRVSDAIGGQMLDLEPAFALNEEYLLVAYDSSINVYSVATSLLVRRLCISKSDHITSFALSPSSAGQVFISTISGSIEKWDWIEGTKLEYWNTSIPIYNLATSVPSAQEIWNGLIYTVDRKAEGQWMLTAHRLLGGEDASRTDLGTLFRYHDSLTSARIVENGKVIVLTSGSQIILGSCGQPDPESLKDVFYVWRDLDALKWITSIDIRIRPHKTLVKKSKKEPPINPSAVDIAVGTSDGWITIYDNLLENIIHRENKTKSGKAEGVSSHRLHWHRYPVLAAKWSADGNYLISGGLETVLVIWQLDTTHKQFLPHLSTSIENIVVSPTGSSYCLRLADNSVMILSTSELQPTFNVSGIQTPTMKNSGLLLPYVPSIDAPSLDLLPKQNLRFPAAVSPSSSGRLLLAVPSAINSRLDSKIRTPICYLQTFDVGSVQQISRQALTPTKTTVLNEGPEYNTIEEPHVLHMQVSHDGRWLATVDEWLPPRRDVALLAFDKDGEAEEQSYRREIYLRIWFWNELTSTWELTFKIHDPHVSNATSDHDANLVLDLRSDPSSVSFATLGNDYTVKIWKPSARQRHGREVRDKNGTPLTNWSCRYVTHLEPSSSAGKKTRQGAKLIYSPDGSVLAAGYGLSSPSTIFLINPSDGSIQRTLVGLYVGPLFGLGILDRYLIILSHELRVWDLVTEDFSFGFILKSYGLSMERLITATHLAIDARQGTFAIALPEMALNSKKETKVKSHIMIFDPKNPSPKFSVSTPNITTALLPASGQKGYYLIDSAAEIRVVSPKLSIPVPPSHALEKDKASFRSLGNVFGNDDTATPKAEETKVDDSDEDGDDEPQFPGVAPPSEDNDVAIVTQDRLAEIFDTGSALTLPPVTELFKQVFSLFSGKAKR